MEKLNIAELLKDCPTGMKLDCTMFEKVTFVRVQMGKQFPIEIAINGIRSKYLTKEGCFHDITLLPESKCVIFPKGKTTWEGFHRPFKDGDIVALESRLGVQVFIFKEYIEGKNDCARCHMILSNDGTINISESNYFIKRLATEEEKEALFKAIKDKGYRWNEKTKTLEQLIKPIFKKGDKIRVKNEVSEPRIIDDVCDRFYTLVPIGSIDFTDQHNWELVPNKIEPKFKVGDWITNGDYTWKVISVDYLDYTLQNQLGESVYDTIDYVNKAYHLWTINDAKDGDVLACNEEILLFKSYSAPGYISLYCWYNEQTNNFHSREVTNALLTTINKICPVTKKQHNLLFTKMKETGYEWVAEIKTLVRLIQPKFKIGDKVIHKNNRNVIFTITNIENDYYVCLAKKVAFGFHEQDNYELVNEPKFKDGDIIIDNRKNLCIYKGSMHYNKNLIDFYCGYRIADCCFLFKHSGGQHFGDINEFRLASEEEKAKMFQIIKQNGYKWNSETKILEKFIAPKFKVGDRIKYKNGVEQGVILSITDNTYDIAVTNNIGISVRIIDQDEWELIPNKFDINTLIPFESKVLVRHNKDNKWTGSFFSFIDRDLNSHCHKFVTTADKSYPMMIPYKGNEYLLGKVEDCKDFYKIWE